MSLTLVLIGMVLFGPVRGAHAALPVEDLDCGDTLDHSIRLESPVLLCDDTDGEAAITITASDVTLDLNGHPVMGALGLFDDPSAIGITIAENLENVTIRNGSVAGFVDAGITALDAERVTIRNVAVTNIDVDGVKVHAPRSIIDNVTVSGTGGGGIVLHGDGSQLLRSVVTSTGGTGATVFAPDSNSVVERNVVHAAGTDGLVVGGTKSVRKNVVTGAGGAGIDLIAPRLDAVVADNATHLNAGHGFRVRAEGDGNAISLINNSAHDNQQLGFSIESPFAGSTVKRNIAFANNSGDCNVPWCNTLPSLPELDVGCGENVTSSGRLTQHLVCSGDGITIVGKNITLDLGGYAIAGAGTGTGVLLPQGAKDATIRNGAITGFERGVDGSAILGEDLAKGTRLQDLYIFDLAIGTRVGSASVIDDVFSSSIDDLGLLVVGKEAKVKNSVVHGVAGGGAEAAGVWVEGADNTVKDTTVIDSRDASFVLNGIRGKLTRSTSILGSQALNINGSRMEILSNRFVDGDTCAMSHVPDKSTLTNNHVHLFSGAAFNSIANGAVLKGNRTFLNGTGCP